MRAGFSLLLILLVAPWARADTTWVQGGDVSGLWTFHGSPYMVLGTVTVPAQSNLWIGPGVKVQLNGAFRFVVRGELYALGLPGDSILFTSDSLDGGSLWGGMLLDSCSADSIVLEYTIIENARWVSGQLLPGSALVAKDVEQLYLRFSTLRGTRGWAPGGGLHAVNSNVTVGSCAIVDNQGGLGGGIRLDGASSAALKGCEIFRNRAGDGAGMMITGSGSVSLRDCSFRQDSAHVWGGGILHQGSGLLRLENCSFAYNRAATGAGLEMQGTGSVLLEGCEFYGNQAGSEGESIGSAIYFRTGTALVNRCTVVGNAGEDGAVVGGFGMRLNSCLIAFNNPGNGVTVTSEYAEIRYCNVFGNARGAFQRGHAGNPLPFRLGEVADLNANGDSCDVYDNIFAEPLLADTANQDYHLNEFSPCVDGGDPGLPFDPDSTVADIGAYFYPHAARATERPEVGAALALDPAYPNPFNAVTVIPFDLPQAGRVSLRIYNLLGEKVATLLDDVHPAGTARVVWHAEGKSSGVYLAVLETGAERKVEKLMLLK